MRRPVVVRDSRDVPLDTPRNAWLAASLITGHLVTDGPYPHIHGRHTVPARIAQTARGSIAVPASHVEIWRSGCPACPVWTVRDAKQ